VFFAGSADRVLIRFGIPYESQIWFARAAIFVLPAIAYALTLRICRDLQRSEAHPLRGWSGRRIVRTPAGGFAEAAGDEPFTRREVL